MNEENNRSNSAESRSTPAWKRVFALLGVAAVIGFVAWMFLSMMGMGS